MSQRERVTIIWLGVITGVVSGLLLKDMYKCLVTGVIAASVITLRLSMKAKTEKRA
ncbi:MULTISPECIES: hypothetical protein [Bacillus]|uniref:hypothetical protein n=1 Tax=Bacillus TaxID=1386 RepID=UPI00081529F9|nr:MULTISPECIES: hypothetical protein [Bacillus]MDU0071222.1 hypothetical protein [Bacillus sp. IG6]MED8019090.1 hypothetical protein [Bacillus glycinifermentans]WKB77595.1 hypothetical protein QYM22_01385 [Bacillus glycinifermentans]SCA84059.1 putative membrane protein [Bacillus glycinifermentans]